MRRYQYQKTLLNTVSLHQLSTTYHFVFVLEWTTEVTADKWEKDLNSLPILPYEDWLPEWNQLVTMGLTMPAVPATACVISTLLISSHWRHALKTYPNKDLGDFFLQGILQGLRIGFSYSSVPIKSSRQNLKGAHSHPEVVDGYLQAEVSLRRVAGPFSPSILPNCQKSRFGVILKNLQQDKWVPSSYVGKVAGFLRLCTPYQNPTTICGQKLIYVRRESLRPQSVISP